MNSHLAICILFHITVFLVSPRVRSRTGSLRSDRTLTLTLGCAHGIDCVEHYVLCPVVWNTLSNQHGHGTFLKSCHRSVSGMLFLERKYNEGTLRNISVTLYAISKTLMTIRSSTRSINLSELLLVHCKEGHHA